MSNNANKNVVNNKTETANGYYTSAEMFQHLWIVNSGVLSNLYYDHHYGGNNKSIQSDFEDLVGNKWCLKLIYEPNRRIMSLSLSLNMNRNKSGVKIMFSIAAVQQNTGTLNTIKTDSPFDFVKQCTFTKDNFLSKGSDGVPLHILCRMDIVDSSISALISSADKGSGLADDLSQLFISGQHCDVTIDVCGSVFKAHKAVLSARSKVFAAMFEHKMSENKTSRVSITEFKQDIIQELLRFIYTGRAPKLNVLAPELLAAADKYDLQELKRMCIFALIENTNVSTAAAFLVLADRYNAPNLKKHVVKYINSNAALVTATEGWQNLRSAHANLIFDIYEGLAPNLKIK